MVKIDYRNSKGVAGTMRKEFTLVRMITFRTKYT